MRCPVYGPTSYSTISGRMHSQMHHTDIRRTTRRDDLVDSFSVACNYHDTWRTILTFQMSMSAFSDISGSGTVVAPPAVQLALHFHLSGPPQNIPTPTISSQASLAKGSWLKTAQTAATARDAASTDHTIGAVNESKWTERTRKERPWKLHQIWQETTFNLRYYWPKIGW